jgi:hypothetical protein
MLGRDLPAEPSLMNETLRVLAIFTVLLIKEHSGDMMYSFHLHCAGGCGAGLEPHAEPSLMNKTLRVFAIFTVLLNKTHSGDMTHLQVDAALDLSHTQNIGRMIKTHFPYSQFIVVSLKEGMFNNANVIFRTKFVDGVSAVTRTVNNSK